MTRRVMSRLCILPVAAIAMAPALHGCGDSPRQASGVSDTAQVSGLRTTTLQAGPPTAQLLRPNAYEGDAREIAEGERLFNWMNCAGCHGAQGGGGIGPPLADHDWIYGGESAHIYQSIMQGRPNGMPAYQGRVTDASAWRIAAFVRSLSEGNAPVSEDRTQSGPTDQGARSGNRQ